jgi:hypothetical protein
LRFRAGQRLTVVAAEQEGEAVQVDEDRYSKMASATNCDCLRYRPG